MERVMIWLLLLMVLLATACGASQGPKGETGPIGVPGIPGTVPDESDGHYLVKVCKDMVALCSEGVLIYEDEVLQVGKYKKRDGWKCNFQVLPNCKVKE